MAKSKKMHSKPCRKASLHKPSSHSKKARQIRASEKKEWDNAVCSVCIESPHNAVLLLCSSYENGCRPYMCATSSRYSNCLEQYTKAYANPTPSWQGSVACPTSKTEPSDLICPLCRGEVKGWTVVEPARRYLNAKKRACVQEKCSFVGNYREIRKHVKSDHPKSCPREIDPSQAEKWKKLERERELSDVFSTIAANSPGAIVLGDYVLEGSNYDNDRYFDDAFFSFPPRGERWDREPFDLEDGYRTATLASRSVGRGISRIARPHARFLFARQTRRSRKRRRGGI